MQSYLILVSRSSPSTPLFNAKWYLLITYLTVTDVTGRQGYDKKRMYDKVLMLFVVRTRRCCNKISIQMTKLPARNLACDTAERIILSVLQGLSNGPLEFTSALKIWPLFDLLATDCLARFARLFVLAKCLQLLAFSDSR